MRQIEKVCRMMRDVGVFLLGIAAVTLTVHHLFFRTPTPQEEMQRVVQQHFIQGFEQSLAKDKSK